MAERRIKINWTIIAVLLLLAVIIGIVAYSVYYVPVVPPKYTTGLTGKFKIYDVAGTTLVIDNLRPEFWGVGVDPFARAFTGTPEVVATYDSTLRVWSAPLDAGSYVLTIRDTRTKAAGATYYPIKLTVTVPGTDSEDLEVWISPKQVNIDTRATLTDLTVASPCFPYNTTATYTAKTSMNTTLDAAKNQTGYWFIEYTLDISDTDEIIKEGRMYFSDITDFLVEKVIVDGTEYTPILDTEAADDGMTGYYVTFSEWIPGRHHVTAYVYAVTETSGTFTLKVIEYYECYRTTLRWWTLVSKGITVT